MRSAIITIGELSKRTGVHIETIRYYERVKLLPDPPRSRGNRRLYDENHLKRLTLIARARELGFSLGEIRALLALADAGNFTCDEMRTLTLDHLESVRAKIANLQRLEVMLADVASKCRSGKAPDCPILGRPLRHRAGALCLALAACRTEVRENGCGRIAMWRGHGIERLS